jgi:hypothetical protein
MKHRSCGASCHCADLNLDTSISDPINSEFIGCVRRQVVSTDHVITSIRDSKGSVTCTSIKPDTVDVYKATASH